MCYLLYAKECVEITSLKSDGELSQTNSKFRDVTPMT